MNIALIAPIHLPFITIHSIDTSITINRLSDFPQLVVEGFCVNTATPLRAMLRFEANADMLSYFKIESFRGVEISEVSVDLTTDAIMRAIDTSLKRTAFEFKWYFPTDPQAAIIESDKSFGISPSARTVNQIRAFVRKALTETVMRHAPEEINNHHHRIVDRKNLEISYDDRPGAPRTNITIPVLNEIAINLVSPPPERLYASEQRKVIQAVQLDDGVYELAITCYSLSPKALADFVESLDKIELLNVVRARLKKYVPHLLGVGFPISQVNPSTITKKAPVKRATKVPAAKTKAK